MVTRTPAIDRIMEALSPALAAEIEKVVGETGQTLEAEFEKRLQSATRDTESRVQKTADEHLQKSLAETSEKVRQQVTAELQAQFKKQIDQATGELSARFDDEAQKAMAGWAAERAKLEEYRSGLETQLREWQTFAEAPGNLADATSQPEILMRFLRISEPFASSLAVYVTKADGLALWKNRGPAVFPDIVSQQTTDPDVFFKPVVVRGKIVAAVCAAPPFRADVLQFLAASMERAIEMFGLKLKTPMLKPPAPEIRAAAAAAPAAAPMEAAPAAGTKAMDNDAKLHAEARKTARLLVSEIKLYHEQEVRDGRANSDLYKRLHREIDQGRDSYNQRVPAAKTVGRDYFHEELVRILTDNDPSRLGAAYPGPAA